MIADDDADVRQLLTDLLESEGYEAIQARSGGEVLSLLKGVRPDLLLIDLRMPEKSGLDILRAIERDRLGVSSILMTAFGSSSSAIAAMQLGAYDYITKPFELDEVSHAVRRYFDYQSLATEVRVLRGQLDGRDPNERIVGSSAGMTDVYKMIGRVAASDSTVLITGETGTGKELVAEVLHANSAYRRGPLVKVACASLPDTLLESELFGHERGSFTGAFTQRKGRFELASDGTIFLDEIGDLGQNAQLKLLRVLQDHSFERVGGATTIHVKTRVIAATNRDLEREVSSGRFRADLFYRLHVIAIHMPPLRDRRDDIPALVDHFLHKHRFRSGSAPARITEDSIAVLTIHSWPGNVRELENVIERAVVLAQGQLITPRELALSISSTGARRLLDVADLVRRRVPLRDAVADLEKAMIAEAMSQASGNRSAAARGLGIYRRLLYAKMREHGMADPAAHDGAEPDDDRSTRAAG